MTSSNTTKHPAEVRDSPPDAEFVRTRVSLAGLFAGSFAVGTDGFMIAGLLPRIGGDLGVSASTAGQLVTVFSLSFAVGAPLLASLLGRVDRRVVLCCGLLGLAVTNAAAALAPNVWVLFAARVAAALSAAMYSPTATVVAAGLVDPRRRGRAMAVITAGLTLSIVTGVPLGELIGDRWGWRATFAAVAALTTVFAGVLFAALPPVAAPAVATLRERAAALARPGVSRVLLTTVLGILGGYLAYTYIAVMCDALGGHGARARAIALACFGVGAAIGTTSAGFGVDRYGQVATVRVLGSIQTLALVGLAVGALLAPHVGVLPAAVGFTALGVGNWTYSAPQQHRLMRLAPDVAATVISLNGSAIYAGLGLSGALGALTVNIDATVWGHPAGPAFTCAVGAVAALAAVILVGRGRR